MMDFSAYTIQSTTPLRDGDHSRFLRASSYRARKRIWVASFIVNPMVDQDADLAVRETLRALAYAHWRNVDVRLLIGDSQVRSIRVANQVALALARKLELPAKMFRKQGPKSLHSKYAVLDDERVVVGSHNLSPGAINAHREDSICVESTSLNTLLANEFSYHWERAPEDERND